MEPANRSETPGILRRQQGVLLLLLRLGMAGVFVVAAVPKLQAPDLFALDVHNYQMLPAVGVNATAILLPWLEVLVGVLIGLGVWRRACALVMSSLLVVFTIALVTASARGLNISCGCFEVGAEAGHGSLVWAVLRDLFYLAVALALVRWPDGPRPLDLILPHRKRAQALSSLR